MAEYVWGLTRQSNAASKTDEGADRADGDTRPTYPCRRSDSVAKSDAVTLRERTFEHNIAHRTVVGQSHSTLIHPVVCKTGVLETGLRFSP